MAEPGEPDKRADAQLLADVAAKRDPDALAKLYDQYGGVAFGLSLRLISDPGAAEEVVQEAFFNVWRNAPSYNDERGSVRNWILSIVHNQAIDRSRRLRSKQRLDTQLELAEDTLQRPDVWGEVSAALDRQRITQALSSLPREQRATIELAYFGGYSHSEIANLLRIPLGTVKGRLRLGMDKLRAALTESGLEFSAE